MTEGRQARKRAGAVLAALSRLPPETTGAVLIDRDRLRANYLELARIAAPARCAAVIKADAYGLGIGHVAPPLAAAGCRDFFVATPGEGRELRALFPEAAIYALGGLLPGSEAAFAAARVRPVLSSLDQLAAWDRHARSSGSALPAALQIDTGLNRLGLRLEEAAEAAGRPRAFPLALLVGHFACADEPEHPMNRAQTAAFAAVRALFPGIPAAFANSAGILAHPQSHHDLVRPGIALFGCRSVPATPPALRRTVALYARVLQTRLVRPGETVGYGATARAPDTGKPLMTAVVGIGYADGLMRSAGGGTRAPFGLRLPDGSPAPLIGRVSMDSAVVDLSASPDPGRIRAGDWLGVAGFDPPFPGIDDLADRAGTIGYEVLTRLGPRLVRVVVGGGA